MNISSVHGLRASPYKSGYVAAKHALEGLSKVVALEGAPHGVTSNCVNPAYVRTPLVWEVARVATARLRLSQLKPHPTAWPLYSCGANLDGRPPVGPFLARLGWFRLGMRADSIGRVGQLRGVA